MMMLPVVSVIAPHWEAAASRKHNAAASVTPATTAFTSSERLHTPQTTSANSVSSCKSAAFEWPAVQALVLWSYVAGFDVPCGGLDATMACDSEIHAVASAPAGYRTLFLGRSRFRISAGSKVYRRSLPPPVPVSLFLLALRARPAGPHDRQRLRTMPTGTVVARNQWCPGLLVSP
jgi:hypothetical protein